MDVSIVETVQQNTDDFKLYEPRLNQEWVQILINLRMKYSRAFTRKRHSATEAWRQIHTEMVELGAPSYLTVDKIKKKWMNLIARYKHLKFTVSPNTITWPYYDQIDRAFMRNPNIIELRKPNCTKVLQDSDSVIAHDYAENLVRKQKFTNLLIQLRYTYRHLFTGKKNAAKRGWMTIQNKHPDGQTYTVAQLKKCWQNLVQRYRQMLDTESDHSKITWTHFPAMHEVMNQKNPNCIELQKDDEQNLLSEESVVDLPGAHNELLDDLKLEVESNLNELLTSPPNNHQPPKRNNRRANHFLDNNNSSNMDDLLKYLIQRDIKLDEQHEQLINLLQEISVKLKVKEE